MRDAEFQRWLHIPRPLSKNDLDMGTRNADRYGTNQAGYEHFQVQPFWKQSPIVCSQMNILHKCPYLTLLSSPGSQFFSKNMWQASCIKGQLCLPGLRRSQREFQCIFGFVGISGSSVS